MDIRTIAPDQSLSLFVKSISVFEDRENTGKTVLPFFADGYPGILYNETENGLFVSPQKKKMPLLFLYGQTIHPVELHILGNYRLVVFQLYPFVLNSFFNLSPQDLNDDCYDLHQQESTKETIQQLQKCTSVIMAINCISSYLLHVFKAKKSLLDYVIRQALMLIIEKNGLIAVNQLCAELCITPITFQRRFLKEVGISAK